MAQIWVGVTSPVAYLRRLSVVFAVELRLKIITELYLREMSAKQFYEEFGGGSISRVAKHFKKLTDEGWLRYVRTETGGSRRGARENFYRATEFAVFSEDTWALVPYSVRVVISWQYFKQLCERVRDALKVGTLDARADSKLRWTTVLLDQLGWERLVGAVGTLFESIFEEQSDAKLRITHTEETPMLATVALAIFESPARSQSSTPAGGAPRLVEIDKESPIPFSKRVSKVFADELCLKILADAHLHEISAPQYHAEFGGDSVEGIRRRFKTLEKIGWLKKVDEKSGGRCRGAREHFYRATRPTIFDDERWAEVPDSVRMTHSWTTFKQLTEEVKEAMLAGTFEARMDSHLSWSLLRLDQRGWERVAAAVNALFALIFEQRDAAEARLANSGEKPITTTIALAAFESPMKAAKEP